MSLEFLTFAVDADGIGTITLSRPAKLNALNAAMIGSLDAVIARVESEAGIRALIVTGEGDRAFAAGADIEEFATLPPAAAQRFAARGQQVFRRLEQLRKPVIAAINGYALGGGLELAMACAVRLAVEGARLGQPEVKLGVISGYGATQRLPRLVGRGVALELLLTGDPVDARRALAVGLVNQVVAAGELMDAARAMARRMIANAPVALALTLESVDLGAEAGLDQGLQFEAAAFGLTAATADRREGVAAFLEKRKAVFTGN